MSDSIQETVEEIGKTVAESKKALPPVYAWDGEEEVWLIYKEVARYSVRVLVESRIMIKRLESDRINFSVYAKTWEPLHPKTVISNLIDNRAWRPHEIKEGDFDRWLKGAWGEALEDAVDKVVEILSRSPSRAGRRLGEEGSRPGLQVEGSFRSRAERKIF